MSRFFFWINPTKSACFLIVNKDKEQNTETILTLKVLLFFKTNSPSESDKLHKATADH